MKKIISILMILLFIGMTRAEIDMEINMDSGGGDIEVIANPNSGDGETTYILNGKNFDDEIIRLDRQDFHDGIAYYFYKIYSLFMEETNPNSGVWNIVGYNSLDSQGLKLRMVLDNYFVPRIEVMKLLNTKEAEINQLRLEIMAMQELIPEEDLCQARLNVVKKLNLTSVACGSTIYYNHMEGDGLIGLTEIAQEEIVIEVVEEEEESGFNEINPETLDIWEKMCLKGLNRFCATLAQYYEKMENLNETEEK